MNRVSGEALDALLAEHVEGIVCQQCGEVVCFSCQPHTAWPCQILLLASEVRDARPVIEKAQGVVKAPMLLGGMRWGRNDFANRMHELFQALAHYEEGTKWEAGK